MIKWDELTEGADFVEAYRYATVRTEGGEARVCETGDGDVALLLYPDGPVDLPLMYGGRFKSYGLALLALATDVLTSDAIDENNR